MAKANKQEEPWISRIRDSLLDLQYGTIQIVVHEGRIVQIDRTERTRMDALVPSSEQKKTYKA